MSDSENLTAPKRAYHAWHDSKGGRSECWLDLFADCVEIHSVGEENPGLEFACDQHSKEGAVAYLSAILDCWDMVHFSPQTYVEQGDLIAMFGRCAWRNKSTGKTAEGDVAHLWRFRDGEVVGLRETFDSAKVVAAVSPD